MDSLESIATYPTNRDNWITTVLIGGVLLLLGFLLVPLVFVYGYVVRVIKDTSEGDSEPPAFGDWGELFVDGLKAWLIGLVYLLVPLVVGIVTIGAALTDIATDGNAGVEIGSLVAGIFLSSVLALVFGYIGTAGIVNFARENRVGAAFDFGVLCEIVFHRDYAVAWLMSILVFIVSGFVGAIPVIGWFLGPFVSFYAMMIAGNLWASGVSAALDSTGRTDHLGGEQPTT